MKPVPFRLLFTLSSLMAAVPALAEEADTHKGWSAGIGGGVFSTPFRDADDVTTVLPYVAYEGDRVNASLFGASYRLTGDGPLDVALIAAPRFQLVEPADSPFLAGMEKRRSTLEGGISVRYATDAGQFRLEALTDTLGRHKGSQVSLKYGFGLQFGEVSVVPSLSVSWQDKKLANYYYGVRASEATATRPAYSTGSAVVPGAGIDIAWPVTDRVRLVAIAGYERLPKTLTRSPIVDEDYTAQLIIGVIRTF